MWPQEDQKAARTSARCRRRSASSGSSVTSLKSWRSLRSMICPCGVCRDSGRTNYQPRGENKELGERTCESCYGSGRENCSPELRGKMYSELAQYIAPKRKAVEINAEIQVSMNVIAERLREGRRRVAEMQAVDVKALPTPEESGD